MKLIEINRDFYGQLSTWAKQSDRRPLLVRGARQVGKSYAIRSWARAEFPASSILELNFEERPDLKRLFSQNLDVERIMDELNLLFEVNLRSPKTLLFIDEIQHCPEAISTLRFFYEKRPALHVIAAGSLIEFVLEEVGFPVGRVESLHLSPLTFFEYLSACGKGRQRNYLEQLDLKEDISEALHVELLTELRAYYRIGGMPKAVEVYLRTRDFSAVSKEHEILLQSYIDDFNRYAKKNDWDALHTVFRAVPGLVGETKVKYSALDLTHTIRGEKLKQALNLLTLAHLVNKVVSTQADRPPLQSMTNQKMFKLLFLDIGLLQHSLGFDWRRFDLRTDLTMAANGALAEQFVGQEILATRSKESRYSLHYWTRSIPGSEAEVDFIVERGGRSVPVEVKSGAAGTFKSLQRYIEKYSPEEAYVLSQRVNDTRDQIRWLPLYLAGRL